MSLSRKGPATLAAEKANPAVVLRHRAAFGADHSIAAKRNVPGLSYFYNIETPVGSGQPNERRSVLLVQYMLDLFLSRHGGIFGIEGLSVTGEFGPDTDRAIRAFQRWLQVSPHAGFVPETGVLTPVHCSLIEGSNGPYVPALLLLNRVWASLEPDTFADPQLLSCFIGEALASELFRSLSS